ncbi:MAG TPA: alpha/beta hydrolase [Stellaceae bacterium]|nr:alpha/beta hydrolase [Stellaceae bacterium]
MISEHLIDPELKPLLESYPQAEFSIENLALRRAEVEAFVKATPIPEGLPVVVTERTVPGPAGAPSVRVLIHRPVETDRPMPALLHVHGGGYVLGAPEMREAIHRELAADLGITIVSVDYRLAPETPHPGPVEDCYAALKWLHAEAEELGVDPTRLAIGGESAGGGLAAALALLARDRGEVPVRFQHLIYPMLDDRTCTASDPNPYTGEFFWTPKNNRFGWSSLLGTAPGSAGISPYAAAARAEDLSGLPPAFISVGALDLFLEENLEYARRLMRAGVPVELHVYPGAFHAFDLARDAQISIAAERDSRTALRRALHGPKT